jgi:hypothetical protein
MIAWAGHAAWMEEWNAYGILVGKPEGKRPLGRPECRLVNNTVRSTVEETGKWACSRNNICRGSLV